jgi:AcrR family transcriptional regulator
MATTKKTRTKPNRTTGRRERRRVETREKIFRTALKLFAKRGFFETTTEDISEAADVGQGTFFNYFPSKQHVLMALFELQVGKIGAARRSAETGRTPVSRILRTLMHRIGEEPGRSSALTRSLIVAFLSSEEARAAAGRMLASARKDLRAIMALGQRQGEIRRTLRPADMASAYQKRVLGTMLFFAINDGSLTTELNRTFRHFWAEVATRKR